MIISVLLPLYKLFPLNYLASKDLNLNIGDLVFVSFRSKEYIGIVWELDLPQSKIKLKHVINKVGYKLNDDIIALIKKASEYYLSALGSVAKLALPVDLYNHNKEQKIKVQDIPTNFNLAPLSLEQNEALSIVQSTNTPSVLKGVTGSGKTEVYFHLTAHYLKNDQQVLIMLPEIALGKQIIERFKQRFHFDPIIWNASITNSQKQEALRGILTNKVKLIIGARSSLFLPYANLGLIIVDEEHDASYKQEDGVLYNARDMAVMRAYISNITKVVLCSATPSIETLYNISKSKYHLVPLPNRYDYATMPEVNVIDMKRQQMAKNSWISEVLVNEIKNTISNKEQVLLFLNRRGYAPVILCRSCGYKVNCPNCSTWMVVHKFDYKLECHHCGHVSVVPSTCLECKQEDTLVACGPGIERIEEEISRLFPNSEVALMSKDQTAKPHLLDAFLKKMIKGEIDILIGTQIITKGYHFPKLTLVGVIDADLGFDGYDLRASERNYQLLHQVGGRAGRECQKGRVFLQSYFPDNLVLSAIKTQTEQEFLNYELNHRKENNMPPFSKMAAIILKGKNEEVVRKFSNNLISVAPNANNIRILGPTKAPIYKLSGKYRYRILLIADKSFFLQKYLRLWISLIKIPSNINVTIDIDPQSFL